MGVQMNNMNKIKRWLSIFILLALMVAMSAPFVHKAQAQAGEIVWSEPINISNSPDLTSTDPFLLPDPAGGVHLFWAERATSGVALNPDTIMYSYWDGETWSKPIDIFFSPESDGTPVVGYPHAVMDDNGRIHLFWLSEPNYPYYSLNYSSAEAGQARYASAWKPKVILADDLIGTKYSISPAYSSPDTLHLIYSSGTQGDRPNEDRAVKYIRSTDLGETWSEAIDLFTSPVVLWGTSDTRMIHVSPSTLYASWTLWDDDGNGYQIYFTRSLDDGMTWDTPIVLTTNREDEYERDWNNLAPLGENLLMAMWEGGWRAYRQAQYSYDGGVTWSDPNDTFPRLIGDNGFVEFAEDSNGTWHAFLAQRLREGTEGFLADDSVSLWHSSRPEGKAWSDPTQAISGESTKAMTNPKVAIVNGNRIVAAWYGSNIYEIMVATGVIPDAPPIPAKPWDEPEAILTHVPTEVKQERVIVETPQPTPTPFIVKPSTDAQTTATFNILFGVVSSLFISLIMIMMVMFRSRH
jgi:hypothetical protein